MSIFKSLGHVALRVNDLDASVAFYNAIGFPEVLRLLNKSGAPWIVYLRVSDSLYLELFPGGPEARVPANGHTGLALATGDASYRDPFGPNLPGFAQVPFDDLEAMSAAVSTDTALVIVEPIPATLGMPLPSPGYLAGLRALCDEQGALLCFDEVQTGLGRTGTVWFHQQEGVTPDLLVTGKGLSGGVYPITATLMSEQLHHFFADHPFIHISTFGGAEPGCVAALAVLDVIESEGFLDRVAELGERFEAGFEGLPVVLRRRGMFMGIAFDDPAGGITATRDVIKAGVFAIFANNDPSVLQFLPPLVISDPEADELIATMRQVLGG